MLLDIKSPRIGVISRKGAKYDLSGLHPVQKRLPSSERVIVFNHWKEHRFKADIRISCYPGQYNREFSFEFSFSWCFRNSLRRETC